MNNCGSAAFEWLVMRKRKKDSFHRSVSGLLSHVAKDRGWEIKLDMHSVFLNWENLAGETYASCSRPCKIVKNVLWIEVDNSSWMQQMQYDKIAFLERLNASLKLSRFSDIKFLLPEKVDDGVRKKEPKIRFESPNREELKEFEQQAGIIEDEKSRDALIRLWYLSKACKKE